MTISTTCNGCELELIAEDEDELILQVQAHLAEAPAGGHSPSHEQVRAVIRARGIRGS